MKRNAMVLSSSGLWLQSLRAPATSGRRPTWHSATSVSPALRGTRTEPSTPLPSAYTNLHFNIARSALAAHKPALIKIDIYTHCPSIEVAP